MQNILNFEEAKRIIRQGIYEGINFSELRKRLPAWRKRQLQSLIFDVMAELGLENVPFPGMLTRPRLTRKPINVSKEGNLNILDLLSEKGFLGKICNAYPHIGPNKITLTVKVDHGISE